MHKFTRFLRSSKLKGVSSNLKGILLPGLLQIAPRGPVASNSHPDGWQDGPVLPSRDAASYIAAANEIAGAEEGEFWMRISPWGVHPNAVGNQVVDRQAANEMAANFARYKPLFGYPVYEGHPDDPEWLRRNPGVQTSKRAVARVKAFEVRDDGPWVHVKANRRGRVLLGGEAPTYSAGSAVWRMRKIEGTKADFRPVYFQSLGLTNEPNIPGTEIVLGLNEYAAGAYASADDSRPQTQPPTPTDTDTMQLPPAILAALSLDPEHTPEDLAAAITAAIESRDAAEARVAELEAAAATEPEPEPEPEPEAAAEEEEEVDAEAMAANERARSFVAAFVAGLADRAIAEGRIAPAGRAEFVAACNERDVDGAIAHLESLKPGGAMNTGAATIAGVAGAKSAANPAPAQRVGAIVAAVNEIMARDKIAHSPAYAKALKERPDLFATAAASD